MLNPQVITDPSGVLWLTWTRDPNAIAYDIIAPSGQHVQAGKNATRARLGNPPQPFKVSISAAHSGTYESVTFASSPAPPTTSSVAMADLKGVNAYSQSDLAAIAALNVKHIRCDFSKASTSWLNTCRANGIKVNLIADYAMGLGTSGDHSDPSDHTAWANLVAAKVTGNSDVIEAVACWNEPWHSSFWGPTPDPTSYFDLLQKMAAAVWAAAPSMKILWSADYNSNIVNTSGDTLWRSHLLTLDTGAFLADPRVHPEIHCYCQTNAPTALPTDIQNGFQRYQQAYNETKAHGHQDPKCWVTEWGWETNLPGDTGAGGGLPSFPVSETQQRDYHVAGYNLMLASGKVERSHSFYFQTSNTWSYNWLKVDNSQKLVCAAVAAL